MGVVPTTRWLALTLSLLSPWAVAAEPPELLSYQGVLTLADGTAVPDGAYTLTFDVYNDPVSTLPSAHEFSQTLTVAVRAGLYSVILSNQNGWELANAFDGPVRYMQVTIDSGEPPVPSGLVLAPRQQIASVPFALVSKTVSAPEAVPDPIPTHAIILWDASPTCPEGYEEAREFANLTVRGADTFDVAADVPVTPGISCDGAYGGGVTGCPAPLERYDDDLEVDELALHGHPWLLDYRESSGFNTKGQGGFGTGKNQDSVGPWTGRPDDFNGRQIGGAGGDAAHLHPFRTVLFCRKT